MRRCVAALAVLLCFAIAGSPPVTGWAAEGGHGGGEKKDAKKGEGKEDKIENGVLNYGPVVVNVLSNKGYRILKLSMVGSAVKSSPESTWKSWPQYSRTRDT